MPVRLCRFVFDSDQLLVEFSYLSSDSDNYNKGARDMP